MDLKLIIKRVFLPIFIIVFCIITVLIATSIYEAQGGNPLTKENTEISETIFTCQSTSKNVAYAYLRGFGDHNPNAFDFQRGLIGDNAILDFTYDETLTLNELTEEFISQFNTFAANQDVEEIIIIGQSAGGVIAANAASELLFEQKIELHTLASPLNGYHIPHAFLGEEVGFAKEIATGFTSFRDPQENIKTYHHKTINDEESESYCGSAKAFCNGLKIQQNNLVGSTEYFYDHTHTSIMQAVSQLVIDCHS